MKKIKLGLLPRLILGILIGILLGSLGDLFHLKSSFLFIGMVRGFSTFTSLFSTFLSFIIPLLIVSFVTVGLADLGKKANRLFGFTLLVAYISTILSGCLAFFVGKGILPTLIQRIHVNEVAGTTYSPFITISADPIFGVMTALILAFILGLGIANQEGTVLLNCIRELQEIIKMILDKIIIPLIPVHIAGLFCNIAAEGKLLPTVKMFMKLPRQKFQIQNLRVWWNFISRMTEARIRKNLFLKMRLKISQSHH